MNDLFLRACRNEAVERTPIWIMRQAGRYLPEYRALRERVDFLTLCRTPELAVEASLQPLQRFALDAAIVFSDILVLAEPLGLRVTFEPGPTIDPPVRSADNVAGLGAGDPEETIPYVFETLRLLRAELDGRVPVIGFAAAPFTLASYLVEGHGSRSFSAIKSLLFGDSRTAHRLLDRVSLLTERYLAAQVRAGAQALQLFDTWAGVLGRAEYREFGLRYARRVLRRVRDLGVPSIYFALDAAHLLPDLRECGADVIGVDWRLSLAEASERLDHAFALQGNLDPCALLAPPAVVEQKAREVLILAEGLPGHIFNLGHGILPDTPLASVERLVEVVHGHELLDR